MAEPLLREIRREDGPALIRLWHRVFGDPEALAGHFLRLLPQMGTGAVVELEGRVAGAAYIVDGLALVQADGTARTAAYLYAVAVDESCRGLGLGQAVTKKAAALAMERGAAFICTLPANAGLYRFYEKLIGTRCALYRTSKDLISRAESQVLSLDAEEYRNRRESLLQGRCHLRPSLAVMAYEQFNCEAFGGGLYATGNGIAAAYLEGGRCVVRELLCPPGMDREALAASVGAALGTGRTLLYTPALSGEPYLAAPAGCIPPDCVWNLALD